MLSRAALVILIMGLPSFHFLQSVQTPIARAPQNLSAVLSSPSEGFYYLMNGTDSCAGKIEITNDCGGFKLQSNNGLDYAFCSINKGSSVQMNREGATVKKSAIEVTQEGLVVHRKETTTFYDKGDSLSLQHEDTVMFNQENQILWEHSRNSQGFSCLYSK